MRSLKSYCEPANRLFLVPSDSAIQLVRGTALNSCPISDDLTV